MKILADIDIPLVTHFFESEGDIVFKKGRLISKKDLQDIDVLLIRSVTPIHQALLQDTSVKFVGSATSGMDHMDTAWLDQAGIQWSIAAGCNATAVSEYVVAVIAALQTQQLLPTQSLRAGVIGVGHVGRKVVSHLTALGFEVLQCDPFRVEQEVDFISTPLEDFSDLDLITLHTPLTTTGAYPTYHLIEKNVLQRQKKNTILLNASRGSVIDFSDLKLVGEALIWCLDVFENEPMIDFEVLDIATIATPHIAGYSVQSKFRGIEMIYQAAVSKGIIPRRQLSQVHYPSKKLPASECYATWQDFILGMYNPWETTRQMKQMLVEGESQFDRLRRKFSERYELQFVDFSEVQLAERDRILLQRLCGENNF